MVATMRGNVHWTFLRKTSSLHGRAGLAWLDRMKISNWCQTITNHNYRLLPYYIYNPITAYKTVKECRRCAEKATEEVGQQYVITTYMTYRCMYESIANYLEQSHVYKKHSPTMCLHEHYWKEDEWIRHRRCTP